MRNVHWQPSSCNEFASAGKRLRPACSISVRAAREATEKGRVPFAGMTLPRPHECESRSDSIRVSPAAVIGDVFGLVPKSIASRRPEMEETGRDTNMEDIEFDSLCGNSNWMFLQSKPRLEKKLFEALKAQGIPCYLPMLKQTTEYARRIYSRMTPMFPGYVFASAKPGDLDVARLNSFLRKISFLPPTLSEELLRDLKTVRKYELLAEERRITVSDEMPPGTPVLIRKGWFKGETAVVHRRKNYETVSVHLRSLQMSLSVELPVDFVERA